MLIKKVVLVLISLLIVNTTWADSYTEENKITNFIVIPSVAYRYDVFKWSVPHQNYLNMKVSELVWKNYIIQPSIKIEIEPQPNQFNFLGQVKYGYILKNTSKKLDYDWLGNSVPFSKTLSSVKGNILDLSGVIGYSVNLFNNNLLTFYVGYDYSDYRNKQYGGRQLALNQNKILCPFNKLISKYYFQIQSPWFGLSLNTPLTDKFSIIPTIKFYSFNYNGKGYWLLRDDLKHNPSFKHNAKGNGLGLDLDLLYKFSDSLNFKINLETKKFKMKTGKDKNFFSAKDSGGERVVIRKLFNLSLMSTSISAGFRYKF